MADLIWHTEVVDIDSLKLLDNNPRTITEDKFSQLDNSIGELGNLKPLIGDFDKQTILGGNQRYKALKSNGFTQVEVSFPSRKLTRKEREKIIILDNIHGGLFDMDILANEFELETLQELDFDLTDIVPEPEATEDDFNPDEVEKNIHGVELGDIWLLGGHRLMCGDSTSIENVEKLMNGEKADMVFTDPPYGMYLDADFSKMTSKRSKDFSSGLVGGKYKNVIGDHADFNADLINTLLTCFSYCKEIFLWGANYYTELLDNKNDGSWFVWDKRLDESADKMYGSCFELCWSKNKHKQDIVRVKWAGIFGTSTQDTRKRIHPTQKPIELCSWFVNKWSGESQIIADLFGGSGSTLIACEQLKRKCYMMELDPHYCSVIIERWQKLTGQKAAKLQ